VAIYEIINPSDHYTIECPDTEIAFAACVLLGNGQYAFDPLDETGVKIPIFIFGGHDGWCKATLNASTDDVLDRCLGERRAALADAMDSVIIGNRAAFFAIAPPVGTPEFVAARAKWHDIHRSSLNDIGKRAYAYADKLRQPVAVKESA
jgi:hypothetical protein